MLLSDVGRQNLTDSQTFLALLAMLGLCVAQPAYAASTRFDDWELVCPAQEASAAAASTDAAKTEEQPAEPPSISNDNAKQSCRLQQAQAVNDGRDVVFLFNVVMQESKPVAIISTPLNVYLPAGLELRIDGGGVRRAVFETCNVTGCHAGFALEGTLLNGLRRGNVLTVTIKDSKATQIPLKVSLRGITAGLEALAEQD